MRQSGRPGSIAVAAPDSSVPRWFTRLDPRRRTPVHSIFFVAALVMRLILLSLQRIEIPLTRAAAIRATTVRRREEIQWAADERG
jgi:amino acid transporter